MLWRSRFSPRVDPIVAAVPVHKRGIAKANMEKHHGNIIGRIRYSAYTGLYHGSESEKQRRFLTALAVAYS
jgi:hypothetical protein